MKAESWPKRDSRSCGLPVSKVTRAESQDAAVNIRNIPLMFKLVP